MLELSIDIDPSALVAALGRIPAAIDFRREPMKTAAADASLALSKWEHNQFVAHSGGDGMWAPLKPTTKYERLRRQVRDAGGSKSGRSLRYAAAQAVMPLLYDTGALEAGLFDRGSNGHFVEFTEDAVSEGVRGGTHPRAPISVGELAFAHHYGVAARNLPARPVMGEPAGKILGDIQVDLSKGVSAAFAELAQGVSGGARAA